MELPPNTCNSITAWRFNPQAASLCEYFYPYSRIGIVHLTGQKAMRLDPTAATELPDLEGGVHRLSLRYGHFQRMVAALAADPVRKADPERLQDSVLL